MEGRILAVAVVFTILGAACSSNPDQPPQATATPAAVADLAASWADVAEGLSSVWRTDFSNASIHRDEVIQGQAKGGIPAIDEPKFLAVDEADFLADREPVIAFQIGDDARAYPLQILIWHEIVNDVVGGRPVIVTFCPLCNSSVVFDRRVAGLTLTFGVSGFLRNSDLIMFDRETESWWQQLTGEGVVGEYTGVELEFLPSSIVAWSDFKETFPNGRVLSRDTGYGRDYGLNPYVGYDDVDSSPFLFRGVTDGRLTATERVVAVELNGETVAYPFSRLETQPVVMDVVGGTEIVVFFKPGTLSALDRESIARSEEVGSAVVFRPVVDGRSLRFRAEDDGFVDAETGSRWDIFGRAVEGDLKGEALEAVVSANHFWFAWAAFKPETRVWTP